MICKLYFIFGLWFHLCRSLGNCSLDVSGSGRWCRWSVVFMYIVTVYLQKLIIFGSFALNWSWLVFVTILLWHLSVWK